MMLWTQKTLRFNPRPRGFHLITDELVNQLPELEGVETGLLNLFILHTSASLTINENADPDVRLDFESYFNRSVPENAPYFRHTLEGSDDMPAHLKSSLLSVSLTLPVSSGHLLLGTWQGIYLCEHRNHAGARKVAATLHGSTVSGGDNLFV
jgi:secondary thiamine-phosphate synthase enzyme